jgi:very-short-patch-repair endonuclease
MPRRKAPPDYHALAEKRGFRWLGPEVANTQTKTGWQCKHGHRWEAAYSSIREGTGCPTCVLERRGEAFRRRPEDYLALAEQEGFLWLGPEVPNTKTKTGWECKQGHQWEARFNDIQQGSGCPFCAGLAPKTPEDFHALAAERGFRWLGPEVPNIRTKTWWQCEEGHRWEAVYGNIHRGTGCPSCAGLTPKTPEDYHILAEQRGFRWLGPEVPNIRTKTWWQCEEGHRWEARYSDIQRGSGCPFCSGKAPKVPADYQVLAEQRGFRWLGPEVPNVRTKTWWQCEEGHRWEAVYASIHRGTGCPSCAGLAPKTPEDYHILAGQRGFRWLGPEVPNISTKTAWECEEGHCWEACYNDIRNGYGCPFCAGVVPKTPEDYHVLAKRRGFRWLGPEVRNIHTKTRWECKEGHRWQTRYHDIHQGQGCPVCANRVPKTPADYHTLAEERGFLWLGPEAPDTTATTWWECEEGHRWETSYGHIQQGTGCPVCLDLVQGVQVSQVQRNLCEILDGELNHPFQRYNIDVALNVDGIAIAVEYDAWYWHAHQQERDAQRDQEMISAGWRVLRVKSNRQLPTRVQLDAAISRLLAGETQAEIVLDDWGVGPTKFDID